MSRLPVVHLEADGRLQRVHGTWYRGREASFRPRKPELNQERGIDDFIVRGWAPPQGFITRQQRITAFGSCFAAHISGYLAERGYDVAGKDLDLHAHIVRFGEGMVNTFAIRQQFEWAAGERQIPENLWFGPDKEIASLDPEIRAETYEIMTGTEVFIITLGLSEIWYDKTTGDVFWRAIPAQLFDEDRHGFRLASVEENYANLIAIVDLAHRLAPGAPIVFTLSPVPLVATFRPISCITANSVSKAILRVALDRLMREHGDPNLFYFPAYEIVIEGFPDPFMDDNRHPRPEIIRTVMETFERHYCVG
jgi:hypothetical protein